MKRLPVMFSLLGLLIFVGGFAMIARLNAKMTSAGLSGVSDQARNFYAVAGTRLEGIYEILMALGFAMFFAGVAISVRRYLLPRLN
jgi:hypothetical protein